MGKRSQQSGQSSSSPWLLPLSILGVSVFTLIAVWYTTSTKSPVMQPAKVVSQDALDDSEIGQLDAVAIAKLVAAEFTETAVSNEQLVRIGQRAFELGELGLAEQCYQIAVERNPDAAPNRVALGRLLFCTGRVFEARKMWIPLLKTGGIDLLTLPMLGNAELSFQTETDAIRKGLTSNSNSAKRLANAHLCLEKRDLEAAFELLSPERDSNVWSDHFANLWTRYLALSGKNGELAKWLETTASAFENANPDYLFVKGSLARHNGDLQSALRTWSEGFRLDPGNYSINAKLSELLQLAGRTEDAEFFRKRSDDLRAYQTLCRQIHQSDDLPSQSQLQAVIRICNDLFLYREVTAWATIAKAVDPEATWMNDAVARASGKLLPTDHRVSRLGQMIQRLEKGKRLLADVSQPTGPASASTVADSEIRFEDLARQSGLEFTYQNGGRHSEASRFFEFIGGGVAALDVDLDSYPDLVLTQGGESPALGRTEDTTHQRPTDEYFRNRNAVRFENRTAEAGLTDTGYSHGCASDDIDQDGFPDLYIANAGHNGLFMNNGDGTFSELPQFGSPRWTTSCAMADLTGDGISDIYEVNHIVAAGVHEKMCTTADSTFPCDISKMKAEQDRLWAGDGSGGYRDITLESGIVQDEGIGLGIAVADFDGSGRLSIFVANDARPNFFFVRSENRTTFQNEAAARGLALSAEGAAQACMGVAIGDADSDGRQDIFVTNFFADHNTLYRQDIPSYFTDATIHSGLLAPSHNLLGFGTQFLDADLDGWLDIVLTNGDVADFSDYDSNRPWKQRPQFFQNTEGVFREAASEQIGKYFETPALGRGLATIDWNLDGLTDFVVSDLKSPAALVTNHTISRNSYVKLKLIGTNGPRTPIGAVGTIIATSRTSAQLTAGCGYLAQNEQTFNLAASGNDPELQITWPSGKTHSWRSFEGNQYFLILEDGRIFQLPH